MPETEPKGIGGVYDRLTKVERDLTAISTAFNSVADSLARLERNQAEISRTVNNRGRTDWAVVGTVGGAIAAILVFYTGLVTAPIAADQTRIRDEYRHELSLVREAYDARLFAIVDDIDDLEHVITERTQERYTKTDHANFVRDLNERLRELRK